MLNISQQKFKIKKYVIPFGTEVYQLCKSTWENLYFNYMENLSSDNILSGTEFAINLKKKSYPLVRIILYDYHIW